MPDDGYVKAVVGGSIAGSKINLTVDASAGEIQSTIAWTESPCDVHIHLACSSHKLVLAWTAWRGWATGVARHGGDRLSRKLSLHGDSTHSALPLSRALGACAGMDMQLVLLHVGPLPFQMWVAASDLARSARF